MGRFLMGFKYAFNGVFQAALTQRNMKFHLVAAVVALAAGVYANLSPEGYCILALTVAGVIAAEMFNTAVEMLADEVSKGERNERIGVLKDVAAGAVLVTAAGAAVVGYFLLGVPIYAKITGK